MELVSEDAYRCVKEEDVGDRQVIPASAEDKAECVRPELVSVPVIVQRKVNKHTLQHEIENDDNSNSSSSASSSADVLSYTIPHELCGPDNGGLICSGLRYACAAKEGVCVLRQNDPR